MIALTYVYVLLLCAENINPAKGTKNSVCPESKKLYPRDCRLFYKCVPLLDSAHAHVWVPTRCTAGMVFHPTLKRCVSGNPAWNCKHIEDNPHVEDFIREKDVYKSKLPVYLNSMDEANDINSVINSDVKQESSFLSMLEENSVPFSAVNNPSIDPIGSQMHRLKELINSLKASSTPVPHSTTQVLYQQPNSMEYIESAQKPPTRRVAPFSVSQDLKKTTELNFLPAELHKITAQLAVQTPTLQQQTNLDPTDLSADVFANIKRNLTIDFAGNPQSTGNLVNSLFEKYLSNNSFLSGGEFVKNISRPSIGTTKNPEQAPKISTVIGLNDKNTFTVHNYRNSFVPDVKSADIKSCVEGERLPIPSDCARYYICGANSTIIHTFTCPTNTAFNKIKRMCDVEKPCLSDSGDYKNDVKKQNVINENDNMTCTSHGRFPVRQSTTQYIICIFQDKVGWKPYRLNCPLNMEFCIEKQSCLPKQQCY